VVLTIASVLWINALVAVGIGTRVSCAVPAFILVRIGTACLVTFVGFAQLGIWLNCVRASGSALPVQCPLVLFIAMQPLYSLTKVSGTLAFQILANVITPDKMQIVSFHPEMIYGLPYVKKGISEDALPFDDGTISRPH
jgi:hypothetical protein